MPFLIKAFAATLLLVSLFSVPMPDVLSILIEFFTEESNIENGNKPEYFDSNDPDVIELREMVNEWINSIDYVIWINYLNVASIIVSLGGLYATLKIWKNKPFPYLPIIVVSLIYLLTLWAPWDLLLYFSEDVINYSTFVRRIDFLWNLNDHFKYSLIKSGLIGNFYLATGGICAFIYMRNKIKKANN